MSRYGTAAKWRVPTNGITSIDTNTSDRIYRHFHQFQLLVHDRISNSYADQGGKLILDLSERQRFFCADHGTVVPLPDSYRCPYCLPVGEDECSFAVTQGGRVVLNPS